MDKTHYSYGSLEKPEAGWIDFIKSKKKRVFTDFKKVGNQLFGFKLTWLFSHYII